MFGGDVKTNAKKPVTGYKCLYLTLFMICALVFLIYSNMDAEKMQEQAIKDANGEAIGRNITADIDNIKKEFTKTRK